jgi:uncharacterized protein YkwD
MRSAGLFSLFSVFFFALSTPAPAQVGKPHYSISTETDMDKVSRDILARTNEYRRKNGLQDVARDEELDRLAAVHSRNMANGQVPFSHNGFEDRAEAYRKVEKLFVSAFSENVAVGARNGQEVMEGWIKSPGHRKNIEGAYNRMGIAVVRDKDGALYFTQLFAHGEQAARR